MQFTITEAAHSQLKHLVNSNAGSSVMRIAVLGGGCSGFEYQFGFEKKPQPDDNLFDLSDSHITVVIDPVSQPFLEGATLDYTSTLGKAGFRIINPLADSHCGCGKSFSLDTSRLTQG